MHFVSISPIISFSISFYYPPLYRFLYLFNVVLLFVRRYALVFEDDQHLPTNILQLAAELILQADSSVGLFMLDDSWFWLQEFQPKQELKRTHFTNSYVRNESRTVGSYLITQETARTLIHGGHFFPQWSPIDFQLNFALKVDKIHTHWAYPPLTCAGSAGMEETSSTGGYSIWPEFRDNPNTCAYCCNKFFNVSNMAPYMQLMIEGESNLNPLGNFSLGWTVR